MIDAGLVPLEPDEPEPESTPHTSYKVSEIKGHKGSIRGGTVLDEIDGQYGLEPPTAGPIFGP